MSGFSFLTKNISKYRSQLAENAEGVFAGICYLSDLHPAVQTETVYQFKDGLFTTSVIVKQMQSSSQTVNLANVIILPVMLTVS